MFKNLRKSIKYKLIAIQIATSIVLLVIFAGIYSYVEIESFKQSLKSELNAAADVLAYNTIPAIIFQDSMEAARSLKAMESYDHILNAWIIDNNARLFSSFSVNNFKDYDFPAFHNDTFSVRDKDIIFAKSISDDENVYGTICFRLDITHFRIKIFTIIFIGFGVILIGVLISFFMANYTQRAVSEPLIQLKDTFESIQSSKNFHVRLVKRSDDEVGLLYDGFNDLISEINNYHENLESIVNERTKQLENANRHLSETSMAFEQMNYMLKSEINDRINAEIELKASEEKMRIIMQTMEESVAVYTSEEVKFVNAAFCNMIGYSENEIVGKPTAEISAAILHPEDIELVSSSASACLQNNKIERLEYRYLHKSGAEVWVSGVPAIIPWGNERAIIATLVNITQHRKDKDELRKAMEAAELANRAKSAFLANMSHEIRTPMNAVLGYSQILQRDKSLGETHQKYISAINKSGEHLLALINDILDMSKIEAGRLSFVPVSFDLKELALDMKDIFKAKSEEKELKIVVEIDPEVPRFIKADQSRLRQILINLIGNAVKFSKDGTIKLLISTKEVGILSISVSDQGVGIPSDMIEKIFEPFEQTEKGINLAGGTGLGLTISRKLARLMGGDITVESEINKGSTFKFTCAFERGRPEDVVKIDESTSVVGLKDTSRKIKVLVVDDKEFNRDLLMTMLSSIGFSMLEAVNGEEAVNSFESWKPDVIIMDIVMPVMDGREATKRIRANALGKDVVIIAVTASALDEERAEILQLGVNDFIRKPFRASELLESIRIHTKVEYVYETLMDMPLESDSTAKDWKERVNVIPASLQEKIRMAAQLGDIDLLKENIQLIDLDNHAFADYLTKLTESFNFEDITALFGT